MEPVASVGVSALGRELGEVVQQMKRIEDYCLDTADTGEVDKSDEYTNVKKELYALILGTKQTIRDRSTQQTRNGNSVEVIKMGAEIRKNLELILVKYKTLTQLVRKRKSENDETVMQELTVLKQQIDQCKELATNPSAYSQKKLMNLTDFIKQMDEAGIQPPAEFAAGEGGESSWREPTAEELSVIANWQARDREFDKRIFEVGAGVEGLTEKAEHIGVQLQAQNELIVDITRHAEEANAEVVSLNNRLMEAVGSGPGLNICAKLFLTVVLICLISYAVQLGVNKVKHGLTGGDPSSAFQAPGNRLYSHLVPDADEFQQEFAIAVPHPLFRFQNYVRFEA